MRSVRSVGYSVGTVRSHVKRHRAGDIGRRHGDGRDEVPAGLLLTPRQQLLDEVESPLVP